MKKRNTKISQKLEGLRAPIDKESMWLDIQQFAKSKPITVKWYNLTYKGLVMATSMVTTGLVVLVLIIQNIGPQDNSITESIPNSETKPFENLQNGENDNLNFEYKSLIDSQMDSDLIISEVDSVSSRLEETCLTEKTPLENKRQSNPSIQSVILDSKSNLTSNNSEVFKNVKKNRNSFTGDRKEIEDQDQKQTITKLIEDDLKEASLQKRTSVQDEPTQYADNTAIENKDDKSVRTHEEKVSEIENRGASMLQTDITLPSPKIIEVVSSKTDNWSLGIGLGLGYSHISRTINDVEINDWTKTLLDNIKSVQSYHIDLFLQRKVYKKWSLRLGIDYSRYHDRLDFVNSEITYKKNRISNDSPLFTSENITTSYKLFHKYEFINLGLSVSNSFNWRSWIIAPSIGIVYNQNFSQNGFTLDEYFNLISVNKTYQYVQSIPLRYQTGVSFQKKIDKSMSIDFNLNYRSSATITGSDNSFRMTASRLSAGIGFQYDW